MTEIKNKIKSLKLNGKKITGFYKIKGRHLQLINFLNCGGGNDIFIHGWRDE